MAVEEQVIRTNLELGTTNIKSGLEKLEKNIQALAVNTEKTLASLNKESGLYSDLITKSNTLKEILQDITKYKTGELKENQANNQTLARSVQQYTQIKQYVKDVNNLTSKSATGLKSQTTELDKIQDKFNALNREARQLEGHYKGFGSNKNLDSLKGKLEDIKKQQQIINALSSKGIVNLTSKDLKTLDSAKAKYRALKNEVAEIKTDLSDIPISGLARSAGLRALGYSSLFAGIAGVTQAMRVGVEYTLEYESGIKRLETILDTTNIKAQALEGSLAQLGRTYGEQLGDINKVALELSRAGLALEQVADASEVVIKLALLTGDSIEQSASSIISFVQVFGKDQFGQVTATVDELGAKLAYLANKSRLGTQDINTFANYALASAKATGLTIDAVNGLASAFSNASLNASTIGTQIRKFTIALSSDSGAVQKFFETIGVNQKNLAKRIAQGGAESNKALLEFLDTIKSYNRESYNEALSGVEVLTKNVLQALQNNANEIQTNLKESLQVTSDEIDKAKNITEDYRKTWTKFAENSKNIAQAVFDPLIAKATDLAKALNDSVDEISFFKVSLDEGIQLDTLNNAINTSVNSFERFKKGLGTAEEFNKVNSRIGMIVGTLETLKRQAQEDNNFDSLLKINKLLENARDISKDFSKGKSIILPKLEEAQITKQIQGLENRILKTRELLNNPNIEEGSLPFINLQNEIKAYEKTIENLKGLITTNKKNLKNTAEFFSAEDLDSVNASIIRINRSVEIANSKDLTVLSNLNTDMLKSIEKEIPTFVSKIKSDLEKSNISVDLSNVVSFGDISSKAISIQDKIYELEKSKVNKSKEQTHEIDLQINAYSKAYDQLVRIVDAQTKIENSNNKILQKRKAQTKETQKQYKQEDDRTKTLVKQLIETNKINLTQKEQSDLIAEEIATRQENLILIKSTENYEKEIARISKLQVDLEKAKSKEKEKSELISKRIANKINDEKFRIQELLGLKDKELQSERVLRDLKASKDFRRLSKEEQDVQVAVLENIIKQEKAYKGLSKAITQYRNQVPDLNESIEQLANTGLKSLENNMVDFFDVTSDGFRDMKSLAKNVLQEIYRELIRTFIVKQAVMGISNFVGGIFSGGASVVSSSTAISSAGAGAMGALMNGGSVGIDGYAKGGSVFNKYAGGGKILQGSGTKDDVPIMAMRDEYIIKQSSARSLGKPTLDYINKTGTIPKQGVTGASTVVSTPVSIHIENNTGTPIDAEMVQQMTKKNDSDEYEKVINIMLQAKESDSRIRSAFANTNQ